MAILKNTELYVYKLDSMVHDYISIFLKNVTLESLKFGGPPQNKNMFTYTVYTHIEHLLLVMALSELIIYIFDPIYSLQ